MEFWLTFLIAFLALLIASATFILLLAFYVRALKTYIVSSIKESVKDIFSMSQESLEGFLKRFLENIADFLDSTGIISLLTLFILKIRFCVPSGEENQTPLKTSP